MAGLLYPASIMPADYVPTGASSVVATYAAARTIPLAVITLGAIFKRSASALLTWVFATIVGTWIDPTEADTAHIGQTRALATLCASI
jgi:predicted anti-sigma-YlaC factor YlaD